MPKADIHPRPWSVRLCQPYRRLTAGSRALPDYIVLGAQKAGTTSLHRYLEAHPSVLPCLVKEVQYFSMHHDLGEAWYRSHFPTKRALAREAARHGGTALTGESSPYYLFHPLAPARARGCVPDARLIVLLRDPVERAHSHFHHAMKHGLEDASSFSEALDREGARLAGESDESIAQGTAFHHRNHSYVARGAYATQLRAWLKHYPRDQILVLSAAELTEKPGVVLQEALRFLGLPPFELPEYARHNPSGKAPLDPALRERLAHTFAPSNQELYQLVRRDFGWEPES